MGAAATSSVLRPQTGLSLVEALLVIAIVAVLATMAVPSFADMAARQRLRGASDNLRGDLQFARSEAIKRGAYVYVAFSPGVNWCYSVTLDAACGCGIACGAPESILKQAYASETAAGVELLTVAFAGSFCGSRECVRFDAFHGKALGSNGTATFKGAEGSKYKVIVAPLGRPRVCRASGDPGGGAPAC